MKRKLGAGITAGEERSGAAASGRSLCKVAAVLGLCLAISGCESETVAPAEKDPGAIESSDIVGAWRLTEMGDMKHPMAGGIVELSSSGEMTSHLPSGEKEEAGSATFWLLLHLESGEAIIATDVRFGDWRPELQKLELPMAVVLEGDTMKWNLLEREPGQRAKPSAKTVYQFTRLPSK